MLSTYDIKKMCAPPTDNKAYYRPILCKGEISKVDILFVGTNPATPIYPKDMDLDTYVDLLMNYEKFINYYKQCRIKDGKSEISRTRIGMDSFLGCLSNITDSVIAETEVIPYPTKSLKLLKKEPLDIIERGKEMFYELLMELKPRLLILHGKKTVEYANEILIQKGVLFEDSINLDQSIEVMEKQIPLCSFRYNNEKIANIMACRHFMYYGSKGNSFKVFRENILNILQDN
ncbi:hypothetical protein [Brassicibacter mesophilus]|uniref:hypothetical protein n=1 Tax=Brassicibacter mesophilus TaxID=745119 RepID=UPI003D25BCC6